MPLRESHSFKSQKYLGLRLSAIVAMRDYPSIYDIAKVILLVDGSDSEGTSKQADVSEESTNT